MKNIFLAVLVFSGISLNSFSQVNRHTIGLRGGSLLWGRGIELSYQHGFSESNRLELDFGWLRNNEGGFNHSSLTAIHQWVWNIQGGINWHIGPSAQIGIYHDKYNSNHDGVTGLFGGRVGIELNFNSSGAPLLLGLDVEYMRGGIFGNSFYLGTSYSGAFSLRYIFKPKNK